MASKIFINDDHLQEVIIDGPQNSETMFNMLTESVKYSHELSSKGKPIRILVDMTNMTSMDPGAAKQGLGGASTIAFDRIALYGGSEENNEKVSQIFNLSGKSDAFKIFKTREEAVNWLKQYSSNEEILKEASKHLTDKS